MQITRIKRQRAVDAVYDILRERILASYFRPGERLRIDELAAKLGVSFTPVQHAIHQLAAEGLVEVRPRKGTFVANLTLQDVHESFDIRLALECLAAEKAAVRISDADLAHLKKLLAAMATPVHSREDRKVHERDNSEFHRVIVRAAGSKRLSAMFEDLWAHLQIGRINLASEAGWVSQAKEQSEHEAIVEGLEKHDPVATLAAVRYHVLKAQQVIMESLEQPSTEVAANGSH